MYEPTCRSVVPRVAPSNRVELKEGVQRSMSRRMTASNNSSLPRNRRYKVRFEIPARRATASMLVAPKPSFKNSAVATCRMWPESCSDPSRDGRPARLCGRDTPLAFGITDILPLFPDPKLACRPPEYTYVLPDYINWNGLIRGGGDAGQLRLVARR